MQVYRLGKVPWLDSQLLYHVLPRVGEGGLLLLAPDSPGVSLGFHQDVEQEVDLAFCAAQHIPVLRREMGGGACYLDEDAIGYQLVLSQDHPLVAGTWEARYERLLQPVADVCRTLGVTVERRSLSDLWLGEQRIATSSMGVIEGWVVFVGYVFLDLETTRWTQSLKRPAVSSAEAVAVGEAPVVPLRRVLAQVSERAQIYDTLERAFGELLGPLTPATVTAPLRQAMEYLAVRMSSRLWMYRRTGRRPLEPVHVRSGAQLQQYVHQAPGGLIRAAVEIDEDFDRILFASFSGSFFSYPPEGLQWLEAALENTPVYRARQVLEQAYASLSLETPGVGPEDWLRALGIV